MAPRPPGPCDCPTPALLGPLGNEWRTRGFWGAHWGHTCTSIWWPEEEGPVPRSPALLVRQIGEGVGGGHYKTVTPVEPPAPGSGRHLCPSCWEEAGLLHMVPPGCAGLSGLDQVGGGHRPRHQLWAQRASQSSPVRRGSPCFSAQVNNTEARLLPGHFSIKVCPSDHTEDSPAYPCAHRDLQPHQCPLLHPKPAWCPFSSSPDGRAGVGRSPHPPGAGTLSPLPAAARLPGW